MSKTGRNSECPCGKINPHTGDPMKFKKCCMKNGLMMKLDINDFVTTGHITDVDKNVLYRVSYKNLGGDLPERIDKWLETNVITPNDCWYNSHALALSKEFDELDVVNGWYGFPLSHDMAIKGVSTEEELRDWYSKRFDAYQIGDTDWYRLSFKDPEERKNNQGNEFLFKEDTNVVWYRHSWNIAKGMSRKFEGQDVHFDLTMEFNETYKDTWVDYNMAETSKDHPEIPNYIDEMKSRPNLITDWIKNLDGQRLQKGLSKRILNKEVYTLEVEEEYRQRLREILHKEYRIKEKFLMADYDLDKIIEERVNFAKNGGDVNDFPAPTFYTGQSGGKVYKIKVGDKVIMDITDTLPNVEWEDEE